MGRLTVTAELQLLHAKLDEALSRLQRLEARVQAQDAGAPPWHYLVARPHPWPRQLCVKGRNLTVGQLVSTVRANRLSPEQASEDLELPLAAINEALEYYAEHRDLIE